MLQNYIVFARKKHVSSLSHILWNKWMKVAVSLQLVINWITVTMKKSFSASSPPHKLRAQNVFHMVKLSEESNIFLNIASQESLEVGQLITVTRPSIHLKVFLLQLKKKPFNYVQTTYGKADSLGLCKQVINEG
jgi:hypothetical protein